MRDARNHALWDPHVCGRLGPLVSDVWHKAFHPRSPRLQPFVEVDSGCMALCYSKHALVLQDSGIFEVFSSS